MTQPQQPYQPNPYPQQPQKKSKVWWILGGIALVGILACGGCFAVVGLAADEASKSIDKSLDEEAENDRPTVIKEGAAFEHDKYKVDAGWKVGREFGTVTITGMRVTNDSDEEARTALLDVAFYKGDEVLATVSCSSQELQGNESSRMDCVSGDPFPRGYTEIKVSDAF